MLLLGTDETFVWAMNMVSLGMVIGMLTVAFMANEYRMMANNYKSWLVYVSEVGDKITFKNLVEIGASHPNIKHSSITNKHIIETVSWLEHHKKDPNNEGKWLPWNKEHHELEKIKLNGEVKQS